MLEFSQTITACGLVRRMQARVLEVMSFGSYAVEGSDQGGAEDNHEKGDEGKDIDHGTHLVREFGIRHLKPRERERGVMVARMVARLAEKGCRGLAGNSNVGGCSELGRGR